MSIIYETETLYKKTSTGKMQQWRAWVETTDGTAMVYKVESGQTDGKLTTTDGQIVEKGKQKRTILEQAISEVESKVSKKMDAGYLTDLEKAKTHVIVLPMLAHPFTKRRHNINYPAFVQRKFDGVRCMARIEGDGVTLKSRKGKLFPHMNHIRNEIIKQNSKWLNQHINNREYRHPNYIIDGELYSDEMTFQELVGLVKRERFKEGDDELRLKIKIRVYDCVNLDDLDMPFTDRYTMVSNITNGASYLSKVENFEVTEESQIRPLEARFLAEGYEGAIVRNKAGKYALGKRSADLQKVKTFFDNEYEICGYQEGTGNDSGTVIWSCQTEDGQVFKVRPRGTREDRIEWFNDGDSYIGSMLTVRYQELTDDGIPRFPVGIAVRDYE